MRRVLFILLCVLLFLVAFFQKAHFLNRPVVWRDLKFPPPGSSLWVDDGGFPLPFSVLGEGEHSLIDGSHIFLLPDVLYHLPYKSLEETSDWVGVVNREWTPEPPWESRSEVGWEHTQSFAVAASLVSDWWAIQHGQSLPSAANPFHGEIEQGLSPALLARLYEMNAFPVADGQDPVTKKPVPSSLKKFAEILTMAASDPASSGALQHLDAGNWPCSGFDFRPIDFCMPRPPVVILDRPISRQDDDPIADALHRYGILLAGIRAETISERGLSFSDASRKKVVSGRGVVIVGYADIHDRRYYLYRDAYRRFGKNPERRAAYRLASPEIFSEIFAFPHPYRLTMEFLAEGYYRLRTIDSLGKPAHAEPQRDLISSTPHSIWMHGMGEFGVYAPSGETTPSFRLEKDFFKAPPGLK